MSLINDALKRAKETQSKEAAAVAAPALQPVAGARAPVGGNLWLPVLIGVILLVAVFLLWQWFSGSTTSVRAREMPVVATPAVTSKISVASITSTASVAGHIARVTPVAGTQPVVVPVKPLPPAYKLQGIFYEPRHPMAMINGKTVYVGSKLADARVVAIGANSATIVTASGERKILVLPED